MMEQIPALFQEGAVVQLRSGGPLLTVTSTYHGMVNFMYWNPYSGLYVNDKVDQRCLRTATTQPEMPPHANGMRSTSVTKF